MIESLIEIAKTFGVGLLCVAGLLTFFVIIGLLQTHAPWVIPTMGIIAFILFIGGVVRIAWHYGD